jgi:hypothetical protein
MNVYRRPAQGWHRWKSRDAGSGTSVALYDVRHGAAVVAPNGLKSLAGFCDELAWIDSARRGADAHRYMGEPARQLIDNALRVGLGFTRTQSLLRVRTNASAMPFD